MLNQVIVYCCNNLLFRERGKTMKFQKFFSICLLSTVLISSLCPVVSLRANTVYTNSETNVVSETITFTSDDFFAATEKVYREGKITKEQYRKIASIAFERLGRKGQNKVVRVGHLLYDHYFDNVTWSMMVTAGGGAIGIIVGAIPGINASVAGVISAVISSGFTSYYGADKGVIIRMQLYQIHDEIIGPYYTSKYVSIREQ